MKKSNMYDQRELTKTRVLREGESLMKEVRPG